MLDMEAFDTGGTPRVNDRNFNQPILAAALAVFGTGQAGQAALRLSSGETWTISSQVARIPRGEAVTTWKPGTGTRNLVLREPVAPVRSLLRSTMVPKSIGLSVGFAGTVATALISELAVRALDSADSPQKRMTLLQDMFLAKEACNIGTQTLPQPNPEKQKLKVLPGTRTKERKRGGVVRIHGWSRR